jgi:hypothetical protein
VDVVGGELSPRGTVVLHKPHDPIYVTF